MKSLEVLVLGAAAGGGFPQWNCNCPQCGAVRHGVAGLEPLTEDSLALSCGAGWFLVNASPALTLQLRSTPALWPSALRSSPLLGVVLTNGDIDHTLGLFLLREWQP